MTANQKFLDDWAEVLSLADEVKSDPRLEEAKKLVRGQSPFRDGVVKKAKDLRRDLAEQRLVPNFNRYWVIGQAGIARIYPNQQQITLATVYLPSYRGPFFLVDEDTVSKRTYTMTDFSERQMASFSPPLGGSSFQQPWFVGTPYGDPILSLEQANIVIRQNRRT